MSEDTQIKDTPEVLLEKLRAANAEAKKYREERDALQGRVTEFEEKEAKTKKALKDAKVSAALKDAGVTDNRIAKVLKTDDLTLDDDGNLAGFEQALAEVKKDWPEFFDKKKAVGGKADLFASGEVKQKMTGTEAQVARIFAPK